MKSLAEIQADDERRKAFHGMAFDFNLDALLKIITWLQLRLYSALQEATDETRDAEARQRWHIVAEETNKTLLWLDEYVIKPKPDTPTSAP